MGEVRLTFAATDFGAVSEALINMGVSFRVDPMRPMPADTGRPAATAPSRTPSRGKSPAARKAQAKAARPRDTRPVSAADRLREAITRSQPPSETSPFSAPSGPAEED